MIDRLDRLRTALTGLPPGSLVALPREELLELLGGPADAGGATAAAAAAEAPMDLTVAEVATLFQRAPSTVRQWLESGQLEGYKLFGREWRVTRAAVAALQERQRQGGDRRGPVPSAGSLADWRKLR
ncbi:MAG: hypothetical protein AUH42_00245 [Gemmatimonadetes bacterium 13_1_40CM_70_11]|nr:MAG: hypothetical protein AUH42_00245 [Gemmatimonadetes bacterium 13_1_40CM_70_11]